jgi:hypothetical protein
MSNTYNITPLYSSRYCYYAFIFKNFLDITSIYEFKDHGISMIDIYI